MINHFKIIVPLYNSEDWIKMCLNSVKLQTHKNFECIVLDDLSTDNSAQVAKDVINGDDRFTLKVNSDKAYPLKNIHDGTLLLKPKQEDIIVNLDGDDWLASKQVLSSLNEVYNREKCLMTYGSYVSMTNKKRGKFSRQIPKHVIEQNDYRNYVWCSSHLRTYKFSLWNKIKKEDFLDDDGYFYKMSGDLALMFPLLELSGDKSRYIEDILYVYNDTNPLNEHKVNHSEQLRIEKRIRSLKRYDKIN